MKSIIALILTLGLVACSQNGSLDRKNKKPTTNTSNVEQSFARKQFISTERLENESNLEFSGKLTRIAEILLSTGSIEEAHGILETALKNEPTNSKANFLSALTTIAMIAKGGLERVDALFSGANSGHLKLEKQIYKTQVPEWINFATKMTPGMTQFQDAADVQNFIGNEVIPALEKASAKLKAAQAQEFKVIATGKKQEEKTEKYCRWVETASPYGGTDRNWRCDQYAYMNSYIGAHVVTIDQHDAKIVEGVILGYLNALRIANAYDFADGIKIGKRIDHLKQERGNYGYGGYSFEDGEITFKERVEITNRYPKFMTLRSDNQLDKVATSASDIAKIALSLDEYRTVLCNAKNRSKAQKNNLVKSVCLSVETISNIEEALGILQGASRVNVPTETEWQLNPETGYWEEVEIPGYSVMVDLPTFLNNPMSDLKTLLPTDFDDKGKALEPTIEDKTFNGLFPNGDIIEKVKSRNQ